MGLSKASRFVRIVIPSAAPTIYVGLRLSLAVSLALAIVAEMVGNPKGIGNALLMQQQAMQPENMYVYILTTGFLGLFLNSVFMFATKVLAPGVHAMAERVENE